MILSPEDYYDDSNEVVDSTIINYENIFLAYSNDEYESKEDAVNPEPEKNMIINKLSPEEYFIPEEYDVDFGFFDDEVTKNRILGS